MMINWCIRSNDVLILQSYQKIQHATYSKSNNKLSKHLQALLKARKALSLLRLVEHVNKRNLRERNLLLLWRKLLFVPD